MATCRFSGQRLLSALCFAFFFIRTQCFHNSGSDWKRPPVRLWSTADRSTGPLWHLPNCFETFVNQCSIQSFMFLAKSLKDTQTVLWMENFTRPALRSQRGSALTAHMRAGSQGSRLLTYHGLGAMNATLFCRWDDYFRELLQQPVVIYTVESDSLHIPTYEVEIDPASLCARILSVREQISKEFARDLEVVASMGGQTLDEYWESLRQNEKRKLDKLPTNAFLEMNPDPTSNVASSPLRKGNFDLLVLLTTQESIHRVLNDESRQEGAAKVTNDYLRNFYVKRLISHFSGAQRYNRADDFLQELLESAPSLQRVMGESDSEPATALLDPTRIAELILKKREQVAMEWKELAERAGENHMQLKRLQLNRLMGLPIEPSAKLEGEEAEHTANENDEEESADDSIYGVPPLS